jgi:hypothetical protein
MPVFFQPFFELRSFFFQKYSFRDPTKIKAKPFGFTLNDLGVLMLFGIQCRKGTN